MTGCVGSSRKPAILFTIPRAATVDSAPPRSYSALNSLVLSKHTLRFAVPACGAQCRSTTTESSNGAARTERPRGSMSASGPDEQPVYLKPSKLALHTTIQRIDAQRRANGEAAKWEQELAEMKKNLRDVPQKCHKLIESGEKRDVEKPATAR